MVGITAQRLEIQYTVEPGNLVFKPHYSGFYEVADIGPYSAWPRLGEDSYTVTQDNSVCQWWADLSQYLPA